MITSKNPVFHIRLRGCRLVGLREKAQKISGVVRIACFSVRHLTRVTSLTKNSSVTRSFLLVIKQPDVPEITHRCPSFSGSAWPMHIPLGMIWFRNCRLVTQTSLFPLRYVDTMDGVAIFFSKSKCLLPSRTTFMSPRV
ncbi:hypothetical protein TNCV_1067421 [Trichonephila clavipes]|nr:hypothetical protein TNCV_1067421 [Trichonephila clavipes]